MERKGLNAIPAILITMVLAILVLLVLSTILGDGTSGLTEFADGKMSFDFGFIGSGGEG